MGHAGRCATALMGHAGRCATAFMGEPHGPISERRDAPYEGRRPAPSQAPLSQFGDACYYWYQRRTPCFGPGDLVPTDQGPATRGSLFFLTRVAATAVQVRSCRVSPRVRAPFTFNNVVMMVAELQQPTTNTSGVQLCVRPAP